MESLVKEKVTRTPQAHKNKHSYSQTLPELINCVDLNVLVENYAGAGRRTGSSQVFRCPNPAHDDNSPSFSVFTGRDGKQRASCLSACDFTGDALNFINWHLRLNTHEAANILRSFAGVSNGYTKPFIPKPKLERRLVRTTQERVVDDPSAMSGYLESRGWPADAVETFGLTIMRDGHGILRARHPFYAFTSNGEQVEAGWQARRLDDSSELRWLGQKNVPLPMYNLPALMSADITHVIICEGPADTVTAAIAMREHQNYACVGVAGSNAWRGEDTGLFVGLHVLIACDSDTAGDKLADNITADILVTSLSVSRVQFLDGCDITKLAKTHGTGSLTRFFMAKPDPVATINPVGAEMTSCRACQRISNKNLCAVCASWNGVSPSCAWRECNKCSEVACTTPERKCFMTSGCKGLFASKVVAS